MSKEFDITLQVRIEAESLEEADEVAEALVGDLKEVGKECVDRPIDAATWTSIVPVEPRATCLMARVCPGCVKCGPPIAVKAEQACDGSGRKKSWTR